MTKKLRMGILLVLLLCCAVWVSCGSGDAPDVKNCSHQDLHDVELDLSQHGVCAGKIVYQTCDCGEVKLVTDEQDLQISCELDLVEEDTDSEDGTQKVTVACTKEGCPLVINQVISTSQEGCVINDMTACEFLVGEQTLLDDLCIKMTHTSHANMEQKTIALAEHGACGGELFYYACSECGEKADPFFEFACKALKTQQVPTADGLGEIVTKNCQDCGLRYVAEYATVECGNYSSVTLSLSVGNTSVLEPSAYTIWRSHQYEERVELNGDSCADGGAITEICERCGSQGTTREFDSHDTAKQGKWYDLKVYGACAGEIMTQACPCQAISYLISMNICGDIVNTEEYRDDDGIEHTVTYTTCDNCELKLVQDYYNVNEAERCVAYTVSVGDKVVISKFETIEASNAHIHDWECTAELQGATCLDGVKITLYCDECGESREEISHEHVPCEYVFNIGAYGACGGYVMDGKCACGVVWGFKEQLSCAELITTNESYRDENGLQHEVVMKECKDCGYTSRIDSYSEDIASDDFRCGHTRISAQVAISVGEEEVFTTIMRDPVNESHEFGEDWDERELSGETCLDGIHYISICKKCGYRKVRGSWTPTFHTSELLTTYDLIEYGACSNIEIHGCICGEEETLYWPAECQLVRTSGGAFEDDSGISHIVITRVCEKCGLKFETESYSITTEERKTAYWLYSFSIGDQIILDKYLITKETPVS